MFRLSLKKIRRSRSSQPRLYPSDCPLDSLPVDGSDTADLLQLNDLSYEDALLDRKIANLLQTEYGEASAADPRQSFSAVLRAVDSQQTTDDRRQGSPSS